MNKNCSYKNSSFKSGADCNSCNPPCNTMVLHAKYKITILVDPAPLLR